MKSRTQLGFSLVSVMALAALAGPAAAQQFPTSDPTYSAPDPSLQSAPDVFGAPGQMVISSDFDLDLRFITDSFMGNSDSRQEFTLSPSLLIFLAPNLAVGGLLGFDYTSGDDFSATGLSLGPLLAYNIPVSPKVSLFPTVGLLYSWGQTETTQVGGRIEVSGYDLSLLVRFPVLFHPFQHVFVGITPFTELDFVAKAEAPGQAGKQDTSKTRTFGVTLDLGFWL